jgi:hypothetical protein
MKKELKKEDLELLNKLSESEEELEIDLMACGCRLCISLSDE